MVLRLLFSRWWVLVSLSRCLVMNRLGVLFCIIWLGIVVGSSVISI